MAGILNAELAFPQFPALDQYGPNTTLLLHGDGTNGAQNNTFLDSSTNNFTITRNGNTTQGTFSPFSQPNGWWSNYFAGSQSINAPASTDFQFAGDFTIEAWAYPTTTGDKSVIVQNSGSNYLALNINPGTGFNIYLNSSGPSISPADIIPQVNQWNHVALVRSGSTVKVYLNGVASGTTATNSSTVGYNAAFYIGALGAASSGSFSGYISNIRAVNGTAVYTSNFTPPTSPLTAITNTKLLTCQSNRFLDNSSNAFAITANGTPTVQAFKPFSAPTAYYPAVNGGAGYFDGSGDYLATPTTSQPTASGDFTISCWFYLQSFGANYYAVGGNWTSGTSGEWLIQIQNNGTIRFLTTADGTFAGTVRLNEWTYFSASRSGTTVTVQLNGSTIRTYTLTGTLGVANETINIGQQVGNNWPWNGYIADFNFNTTTATTAVPTAPASVVSGTSLLLKFQNAGIIDSVSQNQLETVGNAQVSTTQSKFGGASMYFDGTGDWLLLNNSPIPSTGDFTVELWFWSSTATTTFQGLFGFLGNSSGYAVTVGLGTTSATGASGVFLNVATGSSSWGINANSPTGITSNSAWYHLALVRSGGTITVYVNGNAVITSTAIASTTALGGGTINRVGALANDYPLNGYIDDFRVTRGIARYTQNFTPPQNAYPDYGPLTNIPTVDPNFKNTTILLHGNGTNGAQNNTFLDSSTNNFTITRNGNTTQGTFTPFSQPNGWWSNYFDGTGNSYLSVANNAALNLGTGDFTIEAWIYPISVNSGNANPVISQLTGASNTGWLFGMSSTSLWQFSTGNTVIVRAGTVVLNQWTHLAAVRISGTTTLYVNGSSVGSTSSSFNFSDTASLLIGYQSSFVYTNCYVSNARIIKGTGAYTSNFTPSSLPLTAITNTSLLTCQSNRFVDNSSNAFAITAGVTTTPQNFYPFFPPLDYSTAAIGGSAYLDGSGDYLSSSVGAIGTGDFTVEFYSYWDNTTTSTGGYFQISTTSGGLSTTYTSGLLAYSNSGTLSFFIGSTFYGTTYTIVPKQWIHIAIVRSSGTVRAYVNGVSVFTPTTDTTNISATYLAIGGYYSTSYLITGYFSNFRLLIGTALYTSNFTPPTAPLTAITNTSFLLSATNAGIFDNASKNDLETVGNAQISTTQSKFGGSSIYLNGSGNYLLSSSAQAYNKFGTADFTVEYWIYLNSAANQQAAVVCGAGTGAYDPIFGWVDSSALQLYLSSAASGWDIASAVTIIPATVSTGVWYHVAVTRNGSTFRTFCNGVQQATFTSSASIYQSAGQINIGRYASGYPINAYFDDIRITNGVCRYNYNFNPPAAPFPNK